jgi:hypothetical protein
MHGPAILRPRQEHRLPGTRLGDGIRPHRPRSRRGSRSVHHQEQSGFARWGSRAGVVGSCRSSGGWSASFASSCLLGRSIRSSMGTPSIVCVASQTVSTFNPANRRRPRPSPSARPSRRCSGFTWLCVKRAAYSRAEVTTAMRSSVGTGAPSRFGFGRKRCRADRRSCSGSPPRPCRRLAVDLAGDWPC